MCILDIVNAHGLYTALLCLNRLPEYERQIRLYMVTCIEQAKHLIATSISYLKVVEQFAWGLCSKEQLAESNVQATKIAKEIPEYESAHKSAAFAVVWATKAKLYVDAALDSTAIALLEDTGFIPDSKSYLKAERSIRKLQERKLVLYKEIQVSYNVLESIIDERTNHEKQSSR